MAITVATVLILILIAGYAAFFAVHNPQVIEVATFRDLNNVYWQSTPVWALPLVGLLVGAIIMAIALSGPWSAMRRAAMLAREQLRVEREKSNQRAKKINALTERIKQLEAGMAGGGGAEEQSGGGPD